MPLAADGKIRPPPHRMRLPCRLALPPPARHIHKAPQSLSRRDIPSRNATAPGPQPLSASLRTAELARRSVREPDYRLEAEALGELSQALANEPDTVLTRLAEVAMRLCGGESAGVSLLVPPNGDAFYWPAIVGKWTSYIGGGTPRNFGPCGVVLDEDSSQLFSHPERTFPYLSAAVPAIEEALLAPFHVQGRAVGTVWVIAHDPERQFDREDQRLLESLSGVAAAAFQSVRAIESLRRDRAALEESDARKDEFLATLAHELRNPLAPIRNALQVLQRSDARPETVKPALSMMERQLGQMVNLIDDLLDVSRISRGRIELRRGRIELASVVHHAVEATQPMFELAHQALTVTLPARPIYLDADPTRIAQVLGNLLNNASKFTPEHGKVSLIVERAGEEAVIHVHDDGIGIAPEELDRIFELFAQVDTSLERTRSGLGIGLTLLRRLVELHGGTVEVRSPGLNAGSEFTVRLPIPADILREAVAHPVPSNTRARRILVVDDNQDAATSLAMLLGIMGHETATAFDGLEALERAASFVPEVVLLDIGLPKLNGYEVAMRLRSMTGGDRLTIVALTGWGQNEDRDRSHQAGFNHHLVKPVGMAELDQLLSEVKG